MQRSKIFLVDDHPVVREGLSQFINSESDLYVCGSAGNAAEALQLIESCQPALVVTDLSLPGRHGLELVKDLAVRHPELPVLVLSLHDEGLWAERVLRAGAEGYMMKSNATTKIVEAIRRILDGGIWVSDQVYSTLLQKQIRNHKPTGSSPLDQLSDRELEVFQRIGHGMNAKEIATAFHLSSKTVEVHLDHIREKLGLKSSTELLRYAVSYTMADA